MANVVVTGEQLDKSIREVVRILEDAVGCTAGPKGLTVAIGKSYGAPEVTKDGYKVIKSIKPEDPLALAIANIITQSASQCNDKVGDGTTTCSILTAKVIEEVSKAKAAGADIVCIKEGVLKAKEAVLEALMSMKREVLSEEEIAQVATISANGDKNIGSKIAQCVQEVGKDGVITVEESKGFKELDVEKTDGMQFDRGYLSPYFVTNSEKMLVEFENPYILLTEKKLNIIQPILPILENVARSGRPLLIIAEDVEGEALSTLVLNKLRGGLHVAAVKAPGFGDRRKDMLGDIAILTGAKHVISDDLAIKMEDLTLAELGTAKNIRITKDTTTIIGSVDNSSANVQSRINQIKMQIEASTSDYDKEKLRERLAKLSGGVAVLKVGGSSEVEVKERKDRVEDALHATRAAVEEGVVPGGGAALLYTLSVLENLKSKNDDEQLGINIVKRALQAPIKRIIKNSGSENAPCVIAHLLKQNDKELIFNVDTMNFANAFTSGVIDPLKVVRIAFDFAVSLAAVFMTLNAIVVDVPSKDDANAGAGGMGGMGGMGGF
ncbi:chaperonin GroL [Ehrlichia chaffeensis str. Heartland]|uniref:Chaperonin GroEL n=16 Tax=Anaplasmataceae TaxID=942 RepID=CH60_EHRCR|nr:chaperonin GroEL [Ehrlichia chaffeensis]P42382.1 RecName: Full=Chaperonin GroEL; AltName: Full=60 kDa chaperonin; AltName: Full=Chaperonin-60; Short=Cpn60 [Ehrlichia chaffeensis]Q2GH98.1 RecName: Full=Chaperonin GroEL; AltName: Full=60 kDa chaperonin; AltName: Full=Chaperonin-60; Short=Cpn60 [Ehrlichia chaffeensis str. Arkansas]AAB49805.1 heat-shock protein [Ehrlichia chaffeensis]ABD44992.1 chaperonin, 60 kd [Ehrlichia chaffeensis str. Arkansas]AHX03474.1 chaperonin GroL [Ehrlichia chaffeen